MDSEEEFVVHGLNQKQSHSYIEIYGEEEEEVDYCGGDEAEEEAEEAEEDEKIEEKIEEEAEEEEEESEDKE